MPTKRSCVVIPIELPSEMIGMTNDEINECLQHCLDNLEGILFDWYCKRVMRNEVSFKQFAKAFDYRRQRLMELV